MMNPLSSALFLWLIFNFCYFLSIFNWAYCFTNIPYCTCKHSFRVCIWENSYILRLIKWISLLSCLENDMATNISCTILLLHTVGLQWFWSVSIQITAKPCLGNFINLLIHPYIFDILINILDLYLLVKQNSS